MKRKHMIILFLVIFLITEAIFFINLFEPSLPVILASLLAAAFVSLIVGTIILTAIYLIQKLSTSKE